MQHATAHAKQAGNRPNEFRDTRPQAMCTTGAIVKVAPDSLGSRGSQASRLILPVRQADFHSVSRLTSFPRFLRVKTAQTDQEDRCHRQPGKVFRSAFLNPSPPIYANRSPRENSASRLRRPTARNRAGQPCSSAACSLCRCSLGTGSHRTPIAPPKQGFFGHSMGPMNAAVGRFCRSKCARCLPVRLPARNLRCW